MKILKYLAVALATLWIGSACEDGKVEYMADKVDPDKALVQISRMIPEMAVTDTRVYRVEIDGVPLYQENYTYLGRLGTLPSISRHYALDAGTHNMKWYLRDGTPYYDGNFTVGKGQRANVFVTDLEADPLVIDNTPDYPNVVTDTTSHYAHLRFINLMYESEGVKYPGKLRYYYQNPFDLEWYPVGEAVGFGEATDWARVEIDKFAPDRTSSGQSGKGSSRNEDDNRTGHVLTAGKCNLYFKIMTCNADGSETGEWFTYSTNGGDKMRDYKDYWEVSIGYHVYHIMRGERISDTDYGNKGAWVSTMNKI